MGQQTNGRVTLEERQRRLWNKIRILEHKYNRIIDQLNSKPGDRDYSFEKIREVEEIIDSLQLVIDKYTSERFFK